MTRLESIKERLKNALIAPEGEAESEASKQFDAHSIPDIEWLLQRLERYENALTVTTTRMSGLITEYQKLNRITDNSISLSEKILNDIEEALKE